MSEMRDDLRKSVIRFLYPALAIAWAFVWYKDHWIVFAALSAWCLWRTVVVWRKHRNEL